MTSTFLPQFHAGTPIVRIRDNRGLAVRELAWRRTVVGGATDICITRHQYNIHGRLAQSSDPRLYAAMQRDNTVRPNFTWYYDLAGSPLRTESVDGGRTISLNDIEGRPLLTVTAMNVIRRWYYEDDTLPGRPLAASELRLEQITPSITERLIWAGNTQPEKGYNLAGQCVRHYDTAGLNRLDSLSLTGATLSQSWQLLADDQEADWKGSNETDWQLMLDKKVYPTQNTTDAIGALLTQIDAMGNQQRLTYDAAGQLASSWLTLVGEDEQVIVKSLTYSAAGQKLREEHGNGVMTDYTYEPQTQRLTGLTTCRPSGHPAGAKVLQDLRYEYDPVGNVISLRNEAEATQFWRNQKVTPENTYTYDTLYQLTRATGREMADIGQQGSQLPSLMTPLPTDNSAYTNYTRTYTYDLGGNLSQIRHRAPATRNNYTTDITVSDRSNRAVLSQPGLTPGEVDSLFDAGGNQILLRLGLLLVWNSRAELQQVTPVSREKGASDQERYRYGGDGMRILKISARQTRNTMQIQRVTYLPGLELRTTHNETRTTEDLHVLTVGEAGRAQVRVLHWEGTPPSGINNNQVRYSYDNLIGSSGLELDGQGEIISQEEYYPYGGTAVWAARSQIEADYKTVRYSGKERDATGLYYYGYRYYQPWVGRWLNPDPAGTIDGLNLFAMVGNNPTLFVDADGRARKKNHKKGEGTSAGASGNNPVAGASATPLLEDHPLLPLSPSNLGNAPQPGPSNPGPNPLLSIAVSTKTTLQGHYNVIKMGHILEGDVNIAKKQITGVHLEPSGALTKKGFKVSDRIAVNNINIQYADKADVPKNTLYEARISDPSRPFLGAKSSTMFPINWSEEAVKLEVASAYHAFSAKVRALAANAPERAQMAQGVYTQTHSGIWVQGYLSPTEAEQLKQGRSVGGINFYPIQNQRKGRGYHLN